MKGTTFQKNKRLASQSPFGETYYLSGDGKDRSKIEKFIKQNIGRKIVVVQGLGFVGSAMLTAVASAKDKEGTALYAVIGVDLPSASSYWKIGMINTGKLPVKSSDDSLVRTFQDSFKSGNIIATADKYAYSIADIILVNINLDAINEPIKKENLALNNFTSAMREIAEAVKPSCLVIIESTLAPGTSEKLLVPLFKAEFSKRGYQDSEIKLAYSYERVMPGKNYLRSITSYYRIFSGINDITKKMTRLFLESIIDTRLYPLTELSSISAAEIGKVLENSYRAANISFIQEWTELAESAGVNLFEIIAGIKKRDTHKNIMLPGFGVGGYCLTKDPLLADWGNIEMFNRRKHLDMTLSAVNINSCMPYHSFNLLKKYLKEIINKRILLMGISYLKDVADTRFSPSELFYKKCAKEGASVIAHDPIVNYWPELEIDTIDSLKQLETEKVDAIVLAVKHDEYIQMQPEQYAKLLKPAGLILDANNIVDEHKAVLLRDQGFRLAGVGKGHWNKILEE